MAEQLAAPLVLSTERLVEMIHAFHGEMSLGLNKDPSGRSDRLFEECQTNVCGHRGAVPLTDDVSQIAA
jgi:hypothetical protein